MYSVLKSSLLLGDNWPVHTVLWVGYPGLSGGHDLSKWASILREVPKEGGDPLIMHGNPPSDPQVVRKSPLFRVV